MKQKVYRFREQLSQLLKNQEFKKEWAALEPEYKLACQLIEKRLSLHVSQRELARRIGTTQAVISRIETMRGNPSLSLLKRIAAVLDSSVCVSFE